MQQHKYKKKYSRQARALMGVDDGPVKAERFSKGLFSFTMYRAAGKIGRTHVKAPGAPFETNSTMMAWVDAFPIAQSSSRVLRQKPIRWG